MKAYISVSFSHRQRLEPVIKLISSALLRRDITPIVFVDEYQFRKEEENAMMQQALFNIDACDMLIAETSEKAIGIGVEAGYARAKGKWIIYLRHLEAEHSTTVAGISHYCLVYKNTEDLQEQLEETLQKVLTSPSTNGRT